MQVSGLIQHCAFELAGKSKCKSKRTRSPAPLPVHLYGISLLDLEHFDFVGK